jgi:hypothetical protein
MNTTNNLKSCLLIMPKEFYSFEKHLSQALNAKGFTVEVANHEYPSGTIGKIMGTLQIPLIFPTTYKFFEKNFLAGRQYDLVLIIKGRGMSRRLIEKMSESAKKIVGYNWDSFKYNKSPLKWYKYVTNYYTFDYSDADRFSIPCVELYSSLPPDTEEKKIEYDISAIARNYSGRLAYIDTVFSTLKPARTFVYIYEQNKFDFILNFLKNPRLIIKYRKYIHFKPLKYNDYINAIKGSEFTIDYAHSNQTGTTMRCYESISLKTKIISNNTYMKRSAYFNDTNCITFQPADKPENLLAAYERCRQTPFNSKARDINTFMDELLA